jgi:hypothetical protein
VESPLMLAPDKKAVVITLLNFGPGLPVPPIAELNVTVVLPFKPTRVSSAEHGKLRFVSFAAETAGEFVVALKVPLRYADFIKFS